MAARSSSTSLKPAHILRITYKELIGLAEKLERQKDDKQLNKKESQELKDNCDSTSKERLNISPSGDAVGVTVSKNVDGVSKNGSHKSKVEQKTAKKNKEKTNRKEDRVKEQEERRKKSRKSSSRSRTKRKQTSTADNGDRHEGSDRDNDEEKDVSGDIDKGSGTWIGEQVNELTEGDEAAELRTRTKVSSRVSEVQQRQGAYKNERSPHDTIIKSVESSSLEASVSDVAVNLKPRGIIKIPQGLGLQEDQNAITESETVAMTAKNRFQADCVKDERKTRQTSDSDPEYSRSSSKGKNRRAVENSKLLFDPNNPTRKPALEKIAERQKAECIASRLQMLNLDKNEDESVGKVLTIGDLSGDVTIAEEQTGYHISDTQVTPEKIKAEKKMRHLNRQKAQQLIKQAIKSETELRNLLRGNFLENDAFSFVKAKSKEIQDSYTAVVTLDVSLAVQKDVDHTLWKNAFYQVIESLRKYIRSFEDTSANEIPCLEETEEVYADLLEFLNDGLQFYKDLLEVLQSTHQFSVEDVIAHPHKVQYLGKTTKFALLSCHNVLIFLGDLERYREQLQSTVTKKWGLVRSYYQKASKLVPKNGKPYNQLAVVAVLANRKLDAVYYYVRSLAVSNPILTAREKLITIFHEIQRKTDQVQRREEEQKKQEMRLKEMQMEQGKQAGHGRGRGRGRPSAMDTMKGVGMSHQDPNHCRHEVWVFVRGSRCRRVVLTESGKVHELNGDDSVTEEDEEEETTRQQSVVADVSLFDVNKKFVLHYLCAHGLLYTRIGMERLFALQHQLNCEFQTLLAYPSCSAVSCSRLLQMMAINMFCIENTAPHDQSNSHIRRGTPQDQALGLSMNMFISLLTMCSNLSQAVRDEGLPKDCGVDHDNQGTVAILRQYLPAVKVWMDWMVQHVALWQASSVRAHVSLWECVAQLVNSIIQLGLPDPAPDEGDEVVCLDEDEFLSGFKPLIESNKPSCRVKYLEHKASIEDSLRAKAILDFANFLTLLEEPVIEWDSDSEMFCAVAVSTPAAPDDEQGPPRRVHFKDVDECKEDSKEDVIVESAGEDEDDEDIVRDEADMNVRELKARKKSLTRKVEEHREREYRAKAVIEEHSSKPRLVMENNPTYLVPDTNCFVDHQDGVRAIVASGDFTVVVPLVVINELDGLKKDFQVNKYGDVNHAQFVMTSARSAVDFLEDEFSKRNPRVKALTSKGSVLETIAFRSEDPSGRKGNNDDVILSCCLHYCGENFANRFADADQQMTIRRKVVLLTDDRNLRLKAYTRNVPVLTVPLFCKMARL